MRVLVVGGAGYIGGAVTDILAGTDHEVRVYDVLLYEEAYRKDVPFVRGDVLDMDALRPHLDWAEAVVWLAAVVGDGACHLNPEVSHEINHLAVRSFASVFEGRIVFTSTCSVYGAQHDVLTEGSPTRPLSVYAATKLAAEQELVGKDALVFRLGTLYGVGDNYSRIRLDLVVNTLTVKACTVGRIDIYGGEQYRPLLHVRDAAAAIVSALERPGAGIFNWHSANARITEIAEAIRRHFPDVEISYTDMKFEDSRNYRVSSTKAERELALRPSRTIDDGIDEVRALIEGGRISDINNPRYLNQAFLSQYYPRFKRSLAAAEPVAE